MLRPFICQPWINWFTQSGIEGRSSLPAGQAQRWPFEHICRLLHELIKHSPGDFGYQHARWSTELLAIKIKDITGCTFHAGTLRRWLALAGLVWRRVAPTLRIRDLHKKKNGPFLKALGEVVQSIRSFMRMKWISTSTPKSVQTDNNVGSKKVW